MSDLQDTHRYHHKCVMLMISYFIRMEDGTILYAHISYSWVTVCGGPILVKEHNYGSHRSSSPVLMESVLSPK